MMYAGVSGGSADARKLAVRLSAEKRRKWGKMRRGGAVAESLTTRSSG